MEIILKYLPDLTGKQRKQLAALYDLCIDWNAKVSVISHENVENLYEHHVLHSLGVARVIQFRSGTKVTGLGTGGGFPGTPFVILLPETRFHLVDSIDKKVCVATGMASTIGLKSVTFHHARAEEEKQPFDLVVSRAIMPLADLIKIIRKNISLGQQNAVPNRLICLRGGELEHETMPFKYEIVIHNLSENSEKEFFKTKKVVYSQVQESGVIETMKIKRFGFNMFPVNCRALWGDTEEAVVIDPSRFYKEEKQALKKFILTSELTVKHLLNTHLYLDHAFGNPFMLKEFSLLVEANRMDEFWIDEASKQGRMFGFRLQEEPVPLGKYLHGEDIATFGHTKLEAIHAPGHSPGSLVYYCKEENCMFSGDVPFQGSIGRADLSGGNFDGLIDHICGCLFVLSNETVVYPRHSAPAITRMEKAENPSFG